MNRSRRARRSPSASPRKRSPRCSAPHFRVTGSENLGRAHVRGERRPGVAAAAGRPSMARARAGASARAGYSSASTGRFRSRLTGAAAPLLLEPPLLDGPRHPDRHTLRLLGESVADQPGQPLHGRVPVGQLGAMPLRHHPQHARPADAAAQPLAQQRPLRVGERRRPVDVEQHGDPRVHLVDVLPAGAAASRGGELQLLVGYLQIVEHLYHDHHDIPPSDKDLRGPIRRPSSPRCSTRWWPRPTRRWLLPARLPAPPAGRTVVVGAGKAAASMALAVEQNWPGELTGLVVTRYGHGLPCRRIEVVEAGHPLPDSSGAGAAARILAMVRGLSADDLVLVLLSGGGSSLLNLPAPGLSLDDVQSGQPTAAALAERPSPRSTACASTSRPSPADGWQQRPGRPETLTFAISDVPGDDPSVIASGPTVGDPSTFADACAIAGALRPRPSPGRAPALARGLRRDAQARRPPARRAAASS